MADGGRREFPCWGCQRRRTPACLSMAVSFVRSASGMCRAEARDRVACEDLATMRIKG